MSRPLIHRAFFRLGLAALVCVSIYVPHLAHFWIPRAGDVDVAAIVRMGSSPNDGTLAEVAAMQFSIQPSIAASELERYAREILAGQLRAPGLMPAPVSLRGYPHDYEHGTPAFQLFVAGLGIESLLLDAFDRTGDPIFLDQALTRLADFTAVDAAALAPTSFLWNDHAIAARVSVIARLWRHVRDNPRIDVKVKQMIMLLVVRTGHLLAAPSHFTVRTNHGVMQNLGLLQIGAAFPLLEEVPAWRALAVERLQLQLTFYVSSEGMVLEHSPGYHVHGNELLNKAVRLVRLNGLNPSAELLRAASVTGEVLADLMRTDGTLPLVGNTAAEPNAGIWQAPSAGAAPLVLQPRGQAPSASRLMPLSGYAIWWNDGGAAGPSQTFVAWAKHDGHGHKHADETSIEFWSGNTRWLSNVGYWPYGAAGYNDANGWAGSNAPHVIGEAATSKRSTSLLSTGSAGSWRFLETERLNEGGARFRRQVVQIDGDTLLVLDFIRAPAQGAEVLWTFGPEIRLSPVDASNYVSNATGDGLRIAMSMQSQPTAVRQQLRGSNAPFAGWVVANRQPMPADAMRVTTGAGESALVSLFKVGRLEQAPVLTLSANAQPEQWAVEIEHMNRSLQIARAGSGLTAAGPETDMTLPLSKPRDIASDVASLRSNYQTAVSRFPPWKNLAYYRLRLMLLLTAVALAAELGWQFARRHAPGVARRFAPHFHALLIGAWLVIALGAHLVYLR